MHSFSLTTSRPTLLTFFLLSNAQQKQGDQFGELSDDHPIQSRATLHLAGMSSTLGTFYTKEAGVILRAVVRFKKRRRLAEQTNNDLDHAV